MKSLVYWHPYIYTQLIKILYGKNFEARYSAIADLIPNNSTVIEACPGDGYLFEHYLKQKHVKYIGLDVNPDFVRTAKRKHIPFAIHDLYTEDIPRADYIVIQASLYQFMPEEHRIIKKLLSAMDHTLIISETVRNLSDSKNVIVSLLAKYAANPGKGHALKRFNKDTLLECFSKYPEFKEIKEINGGRELIGIFRK
jgi:trans-aconitate methyltransferase